MTGGSGGCTLHNDMAFGWVQSKSVYLVNHIESHPLFNPVQALIKVYIKQNISIVNKGK